MEDGLDVVAVRIQDKRGVVTGVVVALPRGAVVLAAVLQGGFVERVDRTPVLRLKRQVVAPRQLALRGRVQAGSALSRRRPA